MSTAAAPASSSDTLSSRSGAAVGPGPEVRRGGVQTVVLIGVLVVAALLRLPALGQNPPGLFVDEASRGYDAYALLLTGADQYGARWPLFAAGLDDHTPTLYTALVIPSIAVLGLSETAVRLPAALVGIVTVGATFLCGRALLGPVPGLIGAGLVAMSPWQILPSRTGAEWGLLPCFMTFGVWLLARGRTERRSLVGAGIVLGVGLYSYAFARLLVPLLVVGYVALWWRELARHWRWGLAGLVILLVIALPLGQFGLTPAGQARLQTVVPLDRYRGLALISYVLANFASYFGPGFLIWGGEPTDHHRLAGFGPILPVMAPLIVAAVAAVIRRPSRGALFCLWWIVAAPASAALHRESPSSALLLGAIPAWHVLAGYGADRTYAWLRSWRPRLARPIAVFLMAAMLLTAGLAARALYVDYPRYAADDWLFGSREVVTYLEAHRDAYDGVLVSDRLLTPHILVLFYARIDPATYQQSPIVVRQPNLRPRGEIGPYQFGRVGDLLQRPGRYLVWVAVDEAPGLFGDRAPVLRVSLPDGSPAQLVYETARR